MYVTKMIWFLLVVLLLAPFALLLMTAITIGQKSESAFSWLANFRESIAPYPYTKEQEARIRKQLDEDL